MDDASLLEVLARRRDGGPTCARRCSTTGARRAPGPASTTATWLPTTPRCRCSTRAGLGWMSEETGAQHVDRDLVVVIDPVDGVDQRRPRHPVVRHQPVCARRRRAPGCPGGRPGPRPPLLGRAGRRRLRRRRADLGRRPARRCGSAVVGLSGYPPRYLGWKQFRASAPRPSICAPWPTAPSTPISTAARTPTVRGTTSAGMLVCREAGAHVAEAFDRPWSRSTTRPGAPRSPPRLRNCSPKPSRPGVRSSGPTIRRWLSRCGIAVGS